jgi:hypothetical protein
MAPSPTTCTCVRCGERAALEPVGCCPVCLIQTRIEFVAGLRRLGEYLAAWAAFDEWCRAERRGPACA